MTQTKIGDTIKVHYTGKLTDGTVFDSSENREPLEFKIGEGRLIKGFEQGVIGMQTGENRELTIPPEEAYGERRDELVAKATKEQLPENMEIAVGQRLQAKQSNGQIMNLIITEVEDDSVTLDANHPLAGQTLTFDIKVVEIA